MTAVTVATSAAAVADQRRRRGGILVGTGFRRDTDASAHIGLHGDGDDDDDAISSALGFFFDLQKARYRPTVVVVSFVQNFSVNLFIYYTHLSTWIALKRGDSALTRVCVCEF